jgi:hypothetical protein
MMSSLQGRRKLPAAAAQDRDHRPGRQLPSGTGTVSRQAVYLEMTLYQHQKTSNYFPETDNL